MAKRGPYTKGIERREAILDASLEIFSKVGHKGASLRAISRELGFSPGLLHHYFSSREELLSAVVDAWDERNEAENAKTEESPLSGFAQSISRNIEIPGLVHLYSTLVIESSDPEHPSRSHIGQRYRELTQSLASDLQNKIDEGLCDKDMDPEQTARLLIAICEGLQLRWLHEPDFDMAQEFLLALDRLGIPL